jgi:hypothetical protein
MTGEGGSSGSGGGFDAHTQDKKMSGKPMRAALHFAVVMAAVTGSFFIMEAISNRFRRK